MAAPGTKRNCRDAHGISGAEGRPAVPSAWRRQPPLTPSRRFLYSLCPSVSPRVEPAFAGDAENEHCSLTSLREAHINIGARVGSHCCHVTFQLTEVAVSLRSSRIS
jgi:hypothetical protein